MRDSDSRQLRFGMETPSVQGLEIPSNPRRILAYSEREDETDEVPAVHEPAVSHPAVGNSRGWEVREPMVTDADARMEDSQDYLLEQLRFIS